MSDITTLIQNLTGPSNDQKKLQKILEQQYIGDIPVTPRQRPPQVLREAGLIDRAPQTVSNVLGALPSEIRQFVTGPKAAAATMPPRALSQRLSNLNINQVPRLPTKLSEDKILEALMGAESDKQAGRTSSAGAKGLFQFKPETAKFIAEKEGLEWRGEKALDDANYSRQLAKAYLNYLSKQTNSNDLRWNLAAYNWGEGNIRDFMKKRGTNYDKAFKYLPEETRKHVHRFLTYATTQE